MRKDEEGEFWARLSGRLLHPVQMQIIEALRLIDLPMSAVDVTKIVEDKPDLSSVAYHFRRLARLGAIIPTETEQIRGALRRPYRLARPDE